MKSILFTLLSTFLCIQADPSWDVIVRNDIPEHTRSILRRDTKADYKGPTTLQWGWTMSDIEGLPAEEQWIKEPVTWLVYDPKADMGDPKDEYIQFNMTCYYQVSKLSAKGDEYHVKQTIEPPFLEEQGDPSRLGIIDGGNVICPEGECLAENCDGLTWPKWDQGYLATHAAVPPARDDKP
ncbi:hypothetical protein I302_105406 [Kwoniella bestiolae CBS 10118]|uniref:Uncharacterized protein n=1 Tax=Kwoniella bestiolae CBS 10118 TaxID=1296100 RepID=A0A1B9FT16_9TREE|nr:hypothetical protein I302_08687 [Kwoniella bestiolae CBS 10118]OCF21908.1 hypothetical protein I302_08687 [Kwoniella bestiolae CBS 10118]